MVAMREIIARPLDAAAFEPFGQVLASPGEVARLDYAAALENARDAARANLLLARAQPTALPHDVAAMERHPYSSQAFFPLDVSRYLILVCPDAGPDTPDLERLQAFIATGNQGINYNAGTWHHPMTTLDREGTFAALVWEDGSQRDTEWYRLDKGERPRVITGD